MSKYTMELGELLELGYQLDLRSYPIFDEAYRDELNQKIIDHFYFREIGQETPDRFNRMLGRKMREIMPLYNQRYRSTLLQFDPLAADYFEQGQQEQRQNSQKAADTVSDLHADQQQQATAAKQKGSADTTLQGTHQQTDAGNYHKQGLKDDVRDENRTDDKTTVGDETTVRTDDLSQNTDRTTNTDQTRTDNLTEETSHDTSRTGEEGNTGNETNADTINSEQTVTNDLTKNQNGQTESNGSRSEQGASSHVTADTPQNNLSVNLVMNQNGTSTTSASGYATTLSQDNERKSASDQEHAENSAVTTDTGTVKTDGNSTDTRQIDTTNKKEYTETVTENGITTNTGTVENTGKDTMGETVLNTGSVNTKSDSTVTDNDIIHTHATDNGTWSEEGNNDSTSDFEEQSAQNQTQEQTEDQQSNSRRYAHGLQNRLTDHLSKGQINSSLWQKGRRGYSPSDLLNAYRSTFINVDMEIMAELETLFMSVW